MVFILPINDLINWNNSYFDEISKSGEIKIIIMLYCLIKSSASK